MLKAKAKDDFKGQDQDQRHANWPRHLETQSLNDSISVNK